MSDAYDALEPQMLFPRIVTVIADTKRAAYGAFMLNQHYAVDESARTDWRVTTDK